MSHADRSTRRRKFTAATRKLSAAALLALLAATAAYAQHAESGVSGTWHVAVPGWGIEDHLLVVQEQGGAVAGKFEFADVKGTVAGTRVQLDVTDEGGRLALRFVGTLSGDHMHGEVTSPPDGPLAQHGLADPLTTPWIATREARKG